jgi:hypothetical protein
VRATGFPFERTTALTVAGWLVNNVFGVTASCLQSAGGLNGPLMTTVAVARLFAVFVSVEPVLTTATFVAVPATFASALTVIERETPAASDPKLQVRTAAPLHAGSLAETNVTCDGSVSTSVTSTAVEGPLFVTVIVYCSSWPTPARVGSTLFVTATSTSGGGVNGPVVVVDGEVGV